VPNISLLNQSNRLTRKQASNHLGVKEGTLAVWATTGRYSIPFYKIGRLVYYNRNDLDAFLESRRVGELIQGA
jgi:excisionase family DNA binding protein